MSSCCNDKHKQMEEEGERTNHETSLIKYEILRVIVSSLHTYTCFSPLNLKKLGTQFLPIYVVMFGVQFSFGKGLVGF